MGILTKFLTVKSRTIATRMAEAQVVIRLPSQIAKLAR
jgi:hypothetical protein